MDNHPPYGHDAGIKPGRRRGAAAVELAICLIPLMTIVMGVIEGGRMMSVQSMAVNAAREGARLSSLSGSSAGTSTGTGSHDVNYRVRSYLSNAGISTASVTVTVSNLDQPAVSKLNEANPGDRIRVRVSLPFSSVALCTPWFFGNTQITATSVMRKEAP